MIRDASIAFLLRVVGAILWLGYTIVLARLLSQEDFGLVLYVVNVLLIATPIATLGFETTTVRFGSQYWHAEDKTAFRSLVRRGRRFAAAGGLMCLLAIVVAAVMGLDSPITNDWTISTIVGIGILASALMTIHRDALRAAGKLVSALMGFSVTRAVLPMVGSVTLGSIGLLTPASALALYLGSLGLSLLFESWQIFRLNLGEPSQPDQQAGREQIRMALGTWPGEIAGVLLARSPGLIVGLVLNLETVALFLAAQRVVALSQFLTDAIRIAAGPEIARAAALSGPDLQKAVSKASALMFVVDSVGKLCLLAVGWFFLYLLGPNYLAAYPILLVFIAGNFSWTLLGPSALVMNMTGLQKQRSIATIVAALVVILSSWAGAVWMGVLGATIGYSLTTWALNAWLIWVLYDRKGIKCGLFGVSVRDLSDLLSGGEIRRVFKRRFSHDK